MLYCLLGFTVDGGFLGVSGFDIVYTQNRGLDFTSF